MATQNFIKFALIVGLVQLAVCNPAKPSFWKGTQLDSTVEEMRSNCATGSDAIACMKFKVVNFLDTIFQKDNFKLFDDTEVRKNDFVGNENAARSESEAVDVIEHYIQSHDVTFSVPIADAKVTVSPKNLNNNELTFNVKYFNEGKGVTEARKSKLKKIVIPIMVFVLLKAMTLIPLALGVLGLKAWNALQLSFFSFVISTAMAIFQLCKKIATDNHHPQIATHAPWETRSFMDSDAQDIAYSAHQ
ncbi:hypothetical protein HA402_002478 [Bradysia odoriphaga]|nr:hypothetical protein HA402_002478 [Bradysia odoriphaga]